LNHKENLIDKEMMGVEMVAIAKGEEQLV